MNGYNKRQKNTLAFIYLEKQMENMRKAIYHLPGLFEFYDFYKEFLKVWRDHREYFYDWCDIGSVYGAPSDYLWGGGRIETSNSDSMDVLNLVNEYSVSPRLTFSNSLINEEHLEDSKCNKLVKTFANESSAPAGVIVHSDLLLSYLKNIYPHLYFVSSTTKVLTSFSSLVDELKRDDFKYVVPDFRLNNRLDLLAELPQEQKDKVEFLCNECCYFGCKDRKECYESVSRKSLGLETNHMCKAPGSGEGYKFSKAMENPGFISLELIKEKYLPMGFTNFKIEGRSLGSALLLEFILYYMTRPEYQIHVRESLYLDNTLDLF